MRNLKLIMPARKILFIFFISAVILILAALSVGCYLFLTENGLRFFVRAALSHYAKSRDVGIEKIQGTFPRTISLQDISLENMKYMPSGSTLEIKKLDVYINPVKIGESNVSVYNGKLKIPGSDPVLFSGAYRDGLLDFNLYSKSMDVRTISGFIGNRALKDVIGTIGPFDIYVKGQLFEPELTGSFHVERLRRSGFLMSDCPVSLILKLKNIMAGPEIYGDVYLNGGEVSGAKTAVVKLQSGKVSFSGKADAPFFDLRGTSDVEGVHINVELKGTVERQDLRLSSEPSLPRGLLLLMLATNKNWKGVEGILNQGRLTPDIAKDFIDYFFFAGTESKIAGYFGISEVLFRYDDKAKGVGVKKDIGGKTEVSYSIEQPQVKEERPVTTQKIGSEVKVTDTVSVEAERELKEDPNAVKPEDKTQTTDKVFLKYKKQF